MKKQKKVSQIHKHNTLCPACGAHYRFKMVIKGMKKRGRMVKYCHCQ